jgi:hypothetical protein
MLARHYRTHRHQLALLNVGQRLFVLERARLAIFARFLVQRQETLKLDYAARSAEIVPSHGEVDSRGVEHCRRHLRTHETLPYELIQRQLILAQVARD